LQTQPKSSSLHFNLKKQYRETQNCQQKFPIQTDGRVSEVRLVCDNCGKLIGISLLPTAKAEAQRKQKTVCQQCKEEATSAKMKKA
jgi:hypothetical protein